MSIALVAAIPSPACTESRPPEPGRAAQPGDYALNELQDGEGIANLPWARGQTFHSLDAYLAHLERQGAMDLPWWHQVEPGILRAGRPPRPRTGARAGDARRTDAPLRFHALASQGRLEHLPRRGGGEGQGIAAGRRILLRHP